MEPPSQVRFWTELRKALVARTTIVDAVREAGRMAGVDQDVIAGLTKHLLEGSCFSACVARYPEFSIDVWQSVYRAESEGRGMLHVVDAVLDYLRHASLDPGGSASGPAGEGEALERRFWRRLRFELTRGTPILEAIEDAGRDAALDRNVVRGVVCHLREGESLADSLAISGWCSPSVVTCLRQAEDEGRGLLPAVEQALRLVESAPAPPARQRSSRKARTSDGKKSGRSTTRASRRKRPPAPRKRSR